MRKFDFNEYKTSQILASLFEESIDYANFGSSMFIRRFMMSNFTSYFDDKSILSLTLSNHDIIEELNNKYEPSNKKEMYTKNQMYWIGYIYSGISLLYKLSLKSVYKIFPSKEIVKYFNIYHTFDIEEAAERMMENIGYVKVDYTTKGVEILKRLYLLDNLKSMIGKDVKVYIDRPLGSVHPTNKDIVYPVNYGYIKEFVALDGEYQDAYILGVNEAIDEFNGKVIAIINRTNDIEDKIVVAKKDSNISIKEIEKKVAFQEKYFKHKIIY